MSEPSRGNRPRVIALDLHFMGAPEVVGSYLIPAGLGEEHVLVDCGPDSTVETLYADLAAAGVEPSTVRHLLLTHIHLDHGGAAGRLARELGLTVYVHARGAGHLERPERLLESARRIYKERMDELWGGFEPVPREQMKVLEGGETLKIGEHAFGALYTPGHAVHHLAYTLGDSVFTGDVGGVRLPGASAVVPPTPPPDINLEAWRESVALLRAYDAGRLYLAHYGEVTDVGTHLDRLEAALERVGRTSLEALRAGEGRDGVAARLAEVAGEEIAGAASRTIASRYELASPYLMAADGLTRYWQRKGAPEG